MLSIGVGWVALASAVGAGVGVGDGDGTNATVLDCVGACAPALARMNFGMKMTAATSTATVTSEPSAMYRPRLLPRVAGGGCGTAAGAAGVTGAGVGACVAVRRNGSLNDDTGCGGVAAAATGPVCGASPSFARTDSSALRIAAAL